MTDIDKLCRRFLLQCLLLLLVATAAAWAVGHYGDISGLGTPVAVSVGFSIVIELADVFIWRRIAKRNPDALTTFYTAVSGFRMLLALATMFVYYLVAERSGIMLFVMVFLAYYVVFLSHHALFFSRVSNDSDKLTK